MFAYNGNSVRKTCHPLTPPWTMCPVLPYKMKEELHNEVTGVLWERMELQSGQALTELCRVTFISCVTLGKSFSVSKYQPFSFKYRAKITCPMGCYNN